MLSAYFMTIDTAMPLHLHQLYYKMIEEIEINDGKGIHEQCLQVIQKSSRNLYNSMKRSQEISTSEHGSKS